MTPAPEPIRVLVADDTATMRLLLRRTLEASKAFEVVGEAANGAEAVDLAGSLQPDMVLLDLSMPVMNGWQLQERLCERGIPVPLVFMTAGYHAQEEAERHGAAGYLAKPFELDDLIQVVRRFAPDPRSHQAQGTR